MAAKPRKRAVGSSSNAVAPGHHGFDEFRQRRRGTQALPQHDPGLRRIERGQGDQLDRPARQQRGYQLVGGSRLISAQGDDDQDRLPGCVIGKVLDHFKRLPVSPVHVFDGQEHGSLRRRRLHH
ncbi:MAG TPA: hypothetical protein VHJ18_06580 [Streptosporangiaceae bacterium]|jgi:hypothetical protein|nr:hypothetical protein [Streptosporangiaceae bacterium]